MALSLLVLGRLTQTTTRRHQQENGQHFLGLWPGCHLVMACPLSAAYLGLYVFYVVTVVLCTWIYRWQRRASLVYSMPGTPGKGLN